MLDFQNLLQSKYPDFAKRHRRMVAICGKFLGFLFYEKRFQQFERDYPHLEGYDFVEGVLRYFDFHLRLRESERARIPATGRVVIAANHPIGSLDGVALVNLVRQVRPDVKVIANEMLMSLPPMRPVLLPVDNMGGNTARQNLKNIRSHLENDGALIIFPAGEVSRFGPSGVRDGVWQSGFVKIASATRAPILPVFVKGRNSIFFYSLSFLAKPLSTAWLIREMFKQSHNTIDARVGQPIPHEVYSANDFSAKKLASMFRKHVYRLGKDGKLLFRSVETVAPPESPSLVRRELEQSEHLGTTADGKEIYLARMADAPCVMREIGRLREMTFRLVGEGSGMPRDIDRYDRDYQQLVLWDRDDQEIVGAYRIGDAATIMAKRGIEGLYTHSLFEFDDSMQPYLQQGLELGRSFVQPKYQTRHALDYLWLGIGAYVRRYPRFRYLFGPASISRFYGQKAIAQLAYYYSTYYDSLDLGVRPRTPFEIPEPLRAELAAEFSGIDAEEDFKALRDTLVETGLPVPTLYKHYSQATEPDGVVFTAFNIDPEFGDCVDGFVLADLTKLKPRKRKRYLGE
jgi:putative hemolysin